MRSNDHGWQEISLLQRRSPATPADTQPRFTPWQREQRSLDLHARRRGLIPIPVATWSGLDACYEIKVSPADFLQVIAPCHPVKPQTPVTRQREAHGGRRRSEEHTSELQSLMRTSYAVYRLKKNN